MEKSSMGEIAKRCPRCGAGFICRHNTPALCQCAGIYLSDAAREYLKANYADCLCAKCLREISEKIK